MLLRRLAFYFLCLLLTFAAGCNGSTRTAQTSDTGAVSAEKSRVIFVRRSHLYNSGLPYTIIDGDGHFVCDSPSGSQVVFDTTPGEHTFIACAQNTPVLKATLAGGKTYYVLVSPRLGVAGSRAQLLAVKAGTDDFKNRDDWIKPLPILVPDHDAGQRDLDKTPQKAVDRLKDAKDTLKDYDKDEMSERTIVPDDGV